jgi:hypothetical protein
MVASQPVDFRKGMDSLAALVMQALASDPFAGDVFIFRSKRAGRIWALPGHQASGERGVHLATGARGFGAVCGAAAATVQRHGLDAARRPRDADAGE